ncbi:metallophosphoesterase family protein [Thermoproteota archaeon]
MDTIIILSDTHGCRPLMKKMNDHIQTIQPTIIFHLGDTYNDAEFFKKNSCELLRIPGVWDQQYEEPYVDNRVFITRYSWRFFLSHTIDSHYMDLPEDTHPEDIIKRKECDVFCYGHTHIPSIKCEKQIIFINPGHLKKDDKRGYPASFALLKLDDQNMDIIISNVEDGKTVCHKEFNKDDIA